MNETIQINSPLLDRDEMIAWSRHWSEENQKSLAQKFFSVYRKAVFARTVEYYVNRYLPHQGVLLEAGSGTSETSTRIDKYSGARRLIALDIVMPVLERVHPVMDNRLCGDIFRLPFGDNSVDGIWNVGVMEHFTQDQIDQIMHEFHRVLKEGNCLVLLWPGVDSIPQRMLRVVEWFVNRNRVGERFRFHPDEISQIRSLRQGREILTRNGFQAIEVEYGFRSLFAFKTLVGFK